MHGTAQLLCTENSRPTETIEYSCTDRPNSKQSWIASLRTLRKGLTHPCNCNVLYSLKYLHAYP